MSNNLPLKDVIELTVKGVELYMYKEQSRAGVAEWYTVPFLLRAAQTVVGLSPNLHQYLQTDLQVHGSERLSCHTDLYTISRCHTRGESEDHTSEKACKESTLALKPRADITRSPKQGYQWPHEKNLCPQIFFKINVQEQNKKIIPRFFNKIKQIPDKLHTYCFPQGAPFVIMRVFCFRLIMSSSGRIL